MCGHRKTTYTICGHIVSAPVYCAQAPHRWSQGMWKYVQVLHGDWRDKEACVEAKIEEGVFCAECGDALERGLLDIVAGKAGRSERY